MKFFFSFYRRNIFVFLLIIIELVLFLANYKEGTYFLGWDNLWPEGNFGANFTRGLFSVWQEYRGVGLVDGMSYAANLPQYVFIYLLSFVFPLNMLRYIFFFFMHFIGGLGIYFLVTRWVLSDKENSKIIGFLAAFFYQFNLATIQMFYAPYELFAVHFAFLPWLVLFVSQFLRTGLKKYLFGFFVFSLFAIPQAHVPTIFFVYLLLICAILASRVFFAFDRKKQIRRVGLILAVILAANAFWLLPYGYSIFGGGAKTVIEANINQMSRDQIYLKHKARGDVLNAVTGKGFMLDVVELNKKGDKFDFIMGPWRDQNNSLLFKVSEVLLLGVVGLGIVNGIFRRNKRFYSFGVVAIVSLFFLATGTPIIGGLNDLIRSNISLIGEAFRFSFTKFSIVLWFCYTIFFALGFFALLNFLREKLSFLRSFIVLTLVGLALIFYSFPAFLGNFLFDATRISIPGEYFSAANFFKEQNSNSRVAMFPQPTYWSWRFNNFGYRGSGFFWYAIPQATLDRAFDPWNSNNENYYWEISYALYSKNLTLFENVLEKYRINWLLLDENIVNPQSPKALFNDELKELIARSDKFVQLAKFREISIYGVNLTRPTKDFVSIATELPGIGPEYKWGNLDRAFVDFGDYVSTKKLSGESLIDSGGSGSSSEICLSSKRMLAFLDRFVNGSGCGPDGNRTRGTLLDKQIPDQPRPTPQDSIAEVYYPFRTLFTGKRQEDLEFDPAKIDTGEKRVFNVSRKCDDDSGKTTECVTIYLPDLVHAQGYVVSVESINYEGLPLAFWVENLNSRKSDLETYLPKRQRTSYFVLPPMEQDGLGYSIHFDSVSVGKERAVNEVGKVTVAPFDYQGMVTQKVGEVGDLRGVGYLSVSNFSVSHPNPSWYQVDLKQPGENLILAQSFENGWVAWDQDWHFLKHKKINNWANGWELLLSSKTVYIFFWPQTLEFIGFGILGSFILVLLFLRVQEK